VRTRKTPSLQAEIVLCIFFKIKRLWLGRNPLTGIVTEFSTGMLSRYDATFFTKDLAVVYNSAAGAVCTGTRVLLLE